MKCAYSFVQNLICGIIPDRFIVGAINCGMCSLGNEGKGKGKVIRPGVAQRVGRSIALLFHDRGTRRGLVVSSTPRPHFTPTKDPVPILQETEWAPGPVWTGVRSSPHRDSIPDRPARSQSLCRLSYPVHLGKEDEGKIYSLY